MNVRVDTSQLEEALRQSKAQLDLELANTRLLQAISSELIHERDRQTLYENIMDAAVTIMRSDFASMQMCFPRQDKAGDLRLLAYRGFTAEAAKFFEWVSADTGCACGVAFKTRKRIVVPDVTVSPIYIGTEPLEASLQTGIRAVQSTPLVSRDGRLVGMISTHWRDPHVPSEHDLRLLDILARQASDLIERQCVEEALRQTDRRKDEFLAMLSHELRNPLAPMQHAVTLLQVARDERTREQASTILERQVRHMTRLVEDLLDVSRISHGHIEMRMREVDLATVIHTAVETSHPPVQAGGHRLDIALPAEPVHVLADPMRLAQVVSNLLNNAAKYTPPGGHIDLKVGVFSGLASISVRDDGIGIPENELPRIFDMFMQLDCGRHRAPGGLGVGLALAQKLVELHNGTLEARSAGPGQGSEFTVRLPTLVSADNRVRSAA